MGLGAGQIGLIAGAALAGPMGALAGAALGSMITKPVTGQLRLEITYTPLRGPHARPPPALRAREPPAEPVAAAAEGAAEAEKVFQATLATRGLAKGGSEGIDWSTLARRVGLVAVLDAVVVAVGVARVGADGALLAVGEAVAVGVGAERRVVVGAARVAHQAG